MVKVFLVRHAESEENAKMIELSKGLARMRHFKLPTWKQTRESLLLLGLDLDAPVSKIGKRQILDQQMRLRDEKFWSKIANGRRPILHVIHSPLIRAKETCLGLFPPLSTDWTLTFENVIVEEKAFLREMYPSEHIISDSGVKKRIKEFENWLLQEESMNQSTLQKEKVYLVVGHSQYFGRMLQSKELMCNCDVFEAVFDCQSGKWRQEDTKLLFRTHLIRRHSLFGHKAVNNADDVTLDHREQRHRAVLAAERRLHGNQENVLPNNFEEEEGEEEEEDEMTCRICACKSSETPHMRMLKRPCKCRGSLSYVHIQCLNQWRATSASAHFTCSVCKHPYILKRTWLANAIMSESGSYAFTFVLILILIAILGLVIYTFCTSDRMLPARFRLNPAHFIYLFSELEAAWWLSCRGMLEHPYNTRATTIIDIAHFFDEASPSHVRGLFAISRLTRAIFSLQFLQLVSCTEMVGWIVDVFITGWAGLGAIGMLQYTAESVREAAREGRDQGLQRLLLLGGWFAGMNSRSMSRLTMVLGCAIAYRVIYAIVLVYGRQLAQTLGETIIEYTNDD